MLAVATVLATGACGIPTTRASRESEEVGVYQALIDSVYRAARKGRTTAEILVSEHRVAPETTFDASIRRAMLDSVPGLPAEAIADYVRVRDDSSAMPRVDAGGRPVRIVPDSVIRHFFPRHGNPWLSWPAFHQAFPRGGGIVRFSRVGFNADRGWAVVYSGEQSDALAGSGSLYVLRREGGRWRVVHVRMLWVS